MPEKTNIDIWNEIKNTFPGNLTIEEKDNKTFVTGTLDAGIKDVEVNITCDPGVVKMRASRLYTYPIVEANVSKFQDKAIKKYSGYYIYVSGQTLSFSRMFSYSSPDELSKNLKTAFNILKDAVKQFEDSCVNFMEKGEESTVEEEYNPENNINFVNVDNSFHAVSTTQQDNDEYDNVHSSYTEKIFTELVEKLNASRSGEHFSVTNENITTECTEYPDASEILIDVSTLVAEDIASMYMAYINENYDEVFCDYDSESQKFSIKKYSYPDEYAPEETEEYIKICQAAMNACIKEYQQTLQKKDSTDFASDVNKILEEQTKATAEKEKLLQAKEEELKSREQELIKSEEKLKEKIQNLEDQKAALDYQLEKERAQLEEERSKMKDEISKYEDRNTQDILKMQSLASQIAELKNKQKTIGGGSSVDEKEMFRLTSKVQQLTNQKIMLEKKLTEKITAKDSKIKQLSDIITTKETELNDLNEDIDNKVKSLLSEELKKSSGKIKELEGQVKEIGHILTPDDLVSFYKQYADNDVRKLHSSTANFVVFTDHSLEVRIKIGDTNYAEVSKEAILKDQVLKKLNSKFNDIKFYNKDNKIVARSYFKKNASPEEVDDVVSVLASNFNK